ncbi:hypothetical protein CGRA01v4_01232 [Colletotrichum graminicola]|nr:hypothetical protein CGRA01v4_01232 [Colletotrichum graminicola]
MPSSALKQVIQEDRQMRLWYREWLTQARMEGWNGSEFMGPPDGVYDWLGGDEDSEDEYC